MSTQTTQALNGVDVQKVMELVELLKQQPGMGEFQFRAANAWLGGPRNQSSIQGFRGVGQEDQQRTKPYEMINDEPPVLAGTDTGANPVEYLLNALAGCITTACIMHAAARGIEIEAIESRIEGDMDIRGFLGLSNEVPKGYQRIRARFRVKSDADAAKLKELMKMSPVYNTIVNPTPVEIEVEKV